MSLWLLLAGYRVYEERQDSEMGISGGKIRLTSYYRRKVPDWWKCLLIIVIVYSWRNFRKNNCEQAENIWLCYEVKQRDQQGRWKWEREYIHRRRERGKRHYSYWKLHFYLQRYKWRGTLTEVKEQWQWVKSRVVVERKNSYFQVELFGVTMASTSVISAASK